MQLYNDILTAKSEGRKLLAILIDPDKIDWENLPHLVLKVNASPASHIFVGGSLVFTNRIDELVIFLKQNSNLPIVLFPGNPSQISLHAHAILLLSLISGRNPDYLIGHHVKAAPILKNSDLEVIPTGYILIESGNPTAVSKVSETNPMASDNSTLILQTAQAGELLGNKLIYLEAGSGAKTAVAAEIINLVSRNIEIPLIVGGGIISKSGIQAAYNAGADLVVIGTAFENNFNFFD